MSVEELIDTMLEGFQGGERWAQGSLAKTAEGFPTDFRHEKAQTFCLVGMRARVCYNRGLSQGERNVLTREFTTRIQAATGQQSVTGFNDTRRSFGEVKAALEAAREGGK